MVFLHGNKLSMLSFFVRECKRSFCILATFLIAYLFLLFPFPVNPLIWCWFKINNPMRRNQPCIMLLSDESYILKCEYFDSIFFNCRLGISRKQAFHHVQFLIQEKGTLHDFVISHHSNKWLCCPNFIFWRRPAQVTLHFTAWLLYHVR